LFEQVAKLTPLPATALQDLARRRADAIVALLVKSGVDRARVSSGAVQAVEGSKEAGIEADLKFDTAS
jgi:outer membrane protein OmpA-like peptidoglycan-associated protein